MIGLRITADLRRRLEKAASESKRTLTEEIEVRLRSTLGDPDAAQSLLGGPVNWWALSKIAAYIGHIERATGERWWRDRYTFNQVKAFVTGLFDFFEPVGAGVTPDRFERASDGVRIAGGLGRAFLGRSLAEVQGALTGARLEAELKADPTAGLRAAKRPARFSKEERGAFLDKLEGISEERTR